MGDLVPKEILDAFRKKKEKKAEIKPIYFLWTFKPSDASVEIWHHGDSPRAEHEYHLDKAARNPDPDLVHGYAYRIKGGFRITDWEHKTVDRFIKNQVVKAIERKEQL